MRPTLLGFRRELAAYFATPVAAVFLIVFLALSAGMTFLVSGFFEHGQADLSVHGGPDKAVYAYPSEHLPLWEEELGHTLGPAPFGENLSTRGATEADVYIGDRWRWDRAVLEVCQPRWPCYKLALYRQRSDIQLLLKGSGRTGWYLRVVEPGEVTVGSPMKVVERDAYLDFVLDNWDDIGNSMLQLSAPQKESVQQYMEARALIAEARSQYWPTITANPGWSRSRSSSSGFIHRMCREGSIR